jgi:hypothetical protein
LLGGTYCGWEKAWLRQRWCSIKRRAREGIGRAENRKPSRWDSVGVNAWRKGSYLDKGGLLGVEEGGVEVLGVPVYTHNAGGGSWYSPGTCTFSLILFPLPTHLHPSDHPSPPPDTHGWVSYFTICLCRIVVEVEDKAAVERDRDLKLIDRVRGYGHCNSTRYRYARSTFYCPLK